MCSVYELEYLYKKSKVYTIHIHVLCTDIHAHMYNILFIHKIYIYTQKTLASLTIKLSVERILMFSD